MADDARLALRRLRDRPSWTERSGGLKETPRCVYTVPGRLGVNNSYKAANN